MRKLRLKIWDSIQDDCFLAFMVRWMLMPWIYSRVSVSLCNFTLNSSENRCHTYPHRGLHLVLRTLQFCISLYSFPSLLFLLNVLSQAKENSRRFLVKVQHMWWEQEQKETQGILEECFNKTLPILVCGSQKASSIIYTESALCVEGQPFNLLGKINRVLPKGLLPVE